MREIKKMRKMRKIKKMREIISIIIITTQNQMTKTEEGSTYIII